MFLNYCLVFHLKVKKFAFVEFHDASKWCCILFTNVLNNFLSSSIAIAFLSKLLLVFHTSSNVSPLSNFFGSNDAFC